MKAVGRSRATPRAAALASSTSSRVAVLRVIPRASSIARPSRLASHRVGGDALGSSSRGNASSTRLAVAYVDETLVDEPSAQELPAGFGGFSGMEGKALKIEKEDIPTVSQVYGVIPKHCFKTNTWTSLKYAAMSTGICLGLGLLANAYIPVKLAFLPLWLAYAAVCGTAGFGFWLIGHEAGHGAFSENALLQDVCGYISHTLCLTPYFSWQRSHAVHHSRVNHLIEGESHVPDLTGSKPYIRAMHWIKGKAGDVVHGCSALFVICFGWIVYLLFGASGGPKYGLTNHFWPYGPFKSDLFPERWHPKVLLSGAGVMAVLGALGYWAYSVGSIWPVMAVYGGPYFVTIAWLGIVTLLHHTDTDVPHLDDEEWTWLRGAFLTIDRPYYKWVDFLQHHIGSTHVVHHLNPKIPHYHAQEATKAVREAFPHLYLYDPTPVHAALWRIVTNCLSVDKVEAKDGAGAKYVYVNKAAEKVRN